MAAGSDFFMRYAALMMVYLAASWVSGMFLNTMGDRNDGTKNLLIIGAGKFSTEIEELARLNGYTDIAFLDDKPSKWSFSQTN